MQELHRNVDSNLRIPSNILLKSTYRYYQSEEPYYMTDTINAFYQYIMQFTDWEDIEIEAKMGFFSFKGAYVYCLKDIKETFILPEYDKRDRNYYNFKYDFYSGLYENQFYSIWYHVDKESQIAESEIVVLPPVNYKETHYESGKRKSIIIREGKVCGEEIIIKKDKKHINIRNNGNDLRITACREEKQTEIASDDLPVNHREKFRVSYKFRFFRLDFTIVSSYKDTDGNPEKNFSYEIEFEFSELKYFLTNDMKSFEDFKLMFLRFIQNIFCLYQTLTPEFYQTKTKKPKFKEDSLFGDYVEKNLPSWNQNSNINSNTFTK